MTQTTYKEKLTDFAELDAVRRVFISRAVREYTNGDYTGAMYCQLMAYDAANQCLEVYETMPPEELEPMFHLWRT